MIVGLFLLGVGLFWLFAKRESITPFFALYCILMGMVSSVAAIATHIGQISKGEVFGMTILGSGFVLLLLNVAVVWRAYFLERKSEGREQQP